jgi:hypothetical protein
MGNSLIIDIEILKKKDDGSFKWELLKDGIDIFACSGLREYADDTYIGYPSVEGINPITLDHLDTKIHELGQHDDPVHHTLWPYKAFYKSQLDALIQELDRKILDFNQNLEEDYSKEEIIECSSNIERIHGLKWMTEFLMNEQRLYIIDESIRYIFYWIC